MTKKKNRQKPESADLSKFTARELAEAFVFPSKLPTTAKEKQEEKEFWDERRRQFANRTEEQKAIDRLLKLTFHLEDYIRDLGGR